METDNDFTTMMFYNMSELEKIAHSKNYELDRFSSETTVDIAVDCECGKHSRIKHMGIYYKCRCGRIYKAKLILEVVG